VRAASSYASFQAWLARGDAEESGPYREFYDLVQLAEAEAEMEVVKLLRDAGKTDWRAAAPFAARRFREWWSEQGPHRETGTGQVTIDVGIALPSTDVVDAVPADTWTAVPRLPAFSA